MAADTSGPSRLIVLRCSGWRISRRSMEIAPRLLCVVVPCFEEEQAIGHTYAELKRVLATLDGIGGSGC